MFSILLTSNPNATAIFPNCLVFSKIATDVVKST